MSKEAARIAQVLAAVREYSIPPVGPTELVVDIEALDDCAVVRLGQFDLVVGSDFVRGTRFHLFQRGIISWSDIGWYVIGANASDLAAMGARPIGVTLICRYTSSMSDEEFGEIMEGVAAACQHFGMPLLGGDTGSFDECVLSATALGVVESGTALIRAGGRHGDILCVSGTVGRAGAAIAYFTRGREDGLKIGEEIEVLLAESWRRIMPPLKQALALRESGCCRAAIDTSDGLKAAIRQLAEASLVDAFVDIDAIPVDPVARAVAEAMEVDPVALAVGDSVDFRLVFTVPEEKIAQVRVMFSKEDWPLYEIGRLEKPRGKPEIVLLRGEERDSLPGIEWSQSDELAIDELRRGRSR